MNIYVDINAPFSGKVQKTILSVRFKPLPTLHSRETQS